MQNLLIFVRFVCVHFVLINIGENQKISAAVAYGKAEMSQSMFYVKNTTIKHFPLSSSSRFICYNNYLVKIKLATYCQAKFFTGALEPSVKMF